MTFELFLLIILFVSIGTLLITIYNWRKEVSERDNQIYDLKVRLHFVTEERDTLRTKIVI